MYFVTEYDVSDNDNSYYFETHLLNIHHVCQSLEEAKIVAYWLNRCENIKNDVEIFTKEELEKRFGE